MIFKFFLLCLNRRFPFCNLNYQSITFKNKTALNIYPKQFFLSTIHFLYNIL